MKYRISEIAPRRILEEEPKRYQVPKPMYGHFDRAVNEGRRTNRSPLVIEPGEGHVDGSHLERVDFFLETKLIETSGKDECSRQRRENYHRKSPQLSNLRLTRREGTK